MAERWGNEGRLRDEGVGCRGVGSVGGVEEVGVEQWLTLIAMGSKMFKLPWGGRGPIKSA